MIRHADGSVTWTADEERCISVAFTDLLAVLDDMPSSLVDFVGLLPEINIRKADILLNDQGWAGVKAYLLDLMGEDAYDAPELATLFLVNDEIAERMLTADEDELYPEDEAG